MLLRSRKFLQKALEPSSCDASWVGPKMAKPSAWKRSTTPSTSGASGPTMVRSTWLFFTKSISPLISSEPTLILVSLFSNCVPALPGATNTSSTSSNFAHCQARACSRPPAPITKTFIFFTYTYSSINSLNFLCDIICVPSQLNDIEIVELNKLITAERK